MPSKVEYAQEDLGFQAANFDWNDYIKWRPKYPPTFFDRLYKTQSENLNKFDTVNDVGAGAGIASEILATKFKKVIVSEPNKEYLAFAETRLNSLEKFEKGKFEFLMEGGEGSSLADGSMDCITVCEALHWTDVETSIKEFGRCLKSGGTLGIFHYSPPRIDDPELAKMWSTVYNYAASRFTQSEVYSRAYQNLRNGYQHIWFDPKIWKEGVQRVYINTNGDLMDLKPANAEDVVNEVDKEHILMLDRVPVKNNVAETDVVEWVEEDRDWCYEVDADWLKNTFKTRIVGRDEEIYQRAVEQITKAVGDRKVKVRHPVVQVIATKR